jgi:hypothetical protein
LEETKKKGQLQLRLVVVARDKRQLLNHTRVLLVVDLDKQWRAGLGQRLRHNLLAQQIQMLSKTTSTPTRST